MSARKTVIVLVLLLIVGGYALYVNHQPAPEKNPKVYHIDEKNIQRIELSSPGRDIVLERGAGDDWKLVKPVAANADKFAAEGVAREIADLEINDTADDHPANLAPFGLAVPAVTVKVTTKDGKALPAILVGKQAPVGSSGFIKVADKPAVLMVSSGFAAEMNKHLDDLRSRSLFTFKPEDADRITITKTGQTLELTKTAGDWKLVEPRAYAADANAIMTMLRTLGASQVNKFVDDNPADPAKYGTTHPSLVLTLAAGKNPAETIDFGFRRPEADAGGIYARADYGESRPVFTVGEDVFAAVDKSFDDLRDKTVMHFDPAKVARVTFVGGPIDETLERAGKDKWTIAAAGKSTSAELPVVSSLMDQLHNLKATRIVADPMTDPNRYGMAKPTITLSLYDDKGAELDALRGSILEVTIKPKSSDEKEERKSFGYVTTNRDAAVFEVPAEAVTDLENTGNRLHSDVAATPTPSPSPLAGPKAPPAAASKSPAG